VDPDRDVVAIEDVPVDEGGVVAPLPVVPERYDLVLAEPGG